MHLTAIGMHVYLWPRQRQKFEESLLSDGVQVWISPASYTADHGAVALYNLAAFFSRNYRLIIIVCPSVCRGQVRLLRK